MKIGIIGAGNIGKNAAMLFAEAGHEVAISNSRGPETLSEMVDEIGSGVTAATVEEAALFGEVVFESIPFGRYRELPVGELAGKLPISSSNYYPGRDGEMSLGGLSHTEAVAAHLPETRVVKAFNTMYYERLANEGRPDSPIEKRLVMFLAGDDAEAKNIVAGLIEEIGFAPVDTGSLAEGGRKQEPGSTIYNVALTPQEAHDLLG